jgi:hypothetical protein
VQTKGKPDKAESLMVSHTFSELFSNSQGLAIV